MTFAMNIRNDAKIALLAELISTAPQSRMISVRQLEEMQRELAQGSTRADYSELRHPRHDYSYGKSLMIEPAKYTTIPPSDEEIRIAAMTAASSLGCKTVGRLVGSAQEIEAYIRGED